MVEITKLLEIQKKLDKHIEKEHPREPEEDRFAKKVLALLVELGECANEWRRFKFWSINQEPRIKESRLMPYSSTRFYEANPLLEEYVDCLHFILSIGLELKYNYEPVPGIFPVFIENQFIELNYTASELYFLANQFGVDDNLVRNRYQELFDCFLFLGKSLGFTWEQVSDAYMLKNKINHQRQESGY